MSQYDLTQVPGCEHYSLEYVRGGRIFSYAHQIDSVISFEPKSVLEIGVGGGMVTAALRSAGLEVTTVDVQPELNPDVVASVTDLPFHDGQFDVALCCQVLEHLPFDQFETSLCELWRCCRLGLVVSLPDSSPQYEVRLRLPMVPQFHWTGTRQRDPGTEYKRRKRELDGHYWEIGYREYALRKVESALVAVTGASVETWRVSDNKYHRFFRVAKRTSG